MVAVKVKMMSVIDIVILLDCHWVCAGEKEVARSP